jgi:hypothetical protein
MPNGTMLGREPNMAGRDDSRVYVRRNSLLMKKRDSRDATDRPKKMGFNLNSFCRCPIEFKHFQLASN